MPSLVAFLTKLTIILSVTFVSLYVLATVFEPASREYRHEVLGLKIADE
ncbi:MAG: histidine kinase [Rhizobiales bacterium]|nr:histidine kinase [Hyphomicrobiales bacterium]